MICPRRCQPDAPAGQWRQCPLSGNPIASAVTGRSRSRRGRLESLHARSVNRRRIGFRPAMMCVAHRSISIFLHIHGSPWILSIASILQCHERVQRSRCDPGARTTTGDSTTGQSGTRRDQSASAVPLRRLTPMPESDDWFAGCPWRRPAIVCRPRAPSYRSGRTERVLTAHSE